jgi:hypothetical protein
MKKWLYRIFWIPVFILTVLFLVANREMVAISLDPISVDNPALTTPALPLWFWLMLMLFIGVAFGAFGMWLSGAGRRQKMRLERRELKTLRKEAALAEKQAQKDPPADPEREDTPLLETSVS